MNRFPPIRCVSPVGIRADPAAADSRAARASLKKRVLTAVVLVPLSLACIFFLPNVVWQLLLCLPIVLGAREWARLAGYSNRSGIAFIAIVLASCLALGVAVSPGGTAARAGNWLLITALMFWMLLVPLWLRLGWRVRQPLLLAAAGWIVLVPMWLAAVLLQRSPRLLLATLLVVWIADTAAYFAGRRFGRRKLAPQISPGKSWEGVIGAFIAVLLYGFVASHVLQPSAHINDRLVTLVFVSALTVLSIVGDLFESWIKRGAGAKDSGSLLPGHGGVLDRIDGLTAALPLAALYFLPELS